MAKITDIGTRIELVPMDGHFSDITVALDELAIEKGDERLSHGEMSSLHISSRRPGRG